MRMCLEIIIYKKSECNLGKMEDRQNVYINLACLFVCIQ